MGAGEGPLTDACEGKGITRVSAEWKIDAGDEPNHSLHAPIYRIGGSPHLDHGIK